VHDQFESVREQGLHHQAHLVFCKTSLRFGLNVKAIGNRPFGNLREKKLFLVLCNLIREFYVSDQREIHRSKLPAVGDINIAGSQRKIRIKRVCRGSVCGASHGRHVERHFSARGNLPVRRLRFF
jgi:hypothetical protein